MTKQQAHALLNAAQQGMKASRQEITRALYATGDMGCMAQEPATESRTASHAWPYYATESGRAALMARKVGA